MQHTLERGGRLRFFGIAVDQIGQLVIEIMRKLVAQIGQRYAAGAQHRHGVLVVGERQQQMLERRIFVIALVGDRKGAVQCLFQVTREHRSISFSTKSNA